MGDIADMYDYGYWPDDDPQEVTCKYCGTPGLWWFPEKRGRYLLKDENGDQHNCMRIREPASLDEFSKE